MIAQVCTYHLIWFKEQHVECQCKWNHQQQSKSECGVDLVTGHFSRNDVSPALCVFSYQVIKVTCCVVVRSCVVALYTH